ncbi:MAG: hypothetical protein IK103_03465 [Bacteroidales bacterium]|nr:hypothetical protein [Bacteroidales bacterium]
MSLLVDYNLATNANHKSVRIFEGLFNDYSFLTLPYKCPSEYVEKYWTAYENYQNLHNPNNSINGLIFEFIIETLFIREGITPFYTQAEISFVPATWFDMVLYNETDDSIAPYSISLKSSLRERWKQADLEAAFLKNVHRKSKCYLLTINREEAASINNKIQRGDAIGLDAVVYCLSEELNSFIKKIKKVRFSESLPDIKVVKSGAFINPQE